MKVRVWGVRGSQASPGPDTARYGGNTSCYEVETGEKSLLVLDAGTGIRGLGVAAPAELERIDILLTHLHMDHIQGLGFFAPLHRPGLDVHIWGPASTTLSLQQRLSRYLSPPLFPVRLRDLPCNVIVHDLTYDAFDVPGATVEADLVCHPGPTCGYRISAGDSSLAYLPDHEPALGAHDFPNDPDWTSGVTLAKGVDLLMHDAQYRHDEYATRVGWGHSTASDAVRFAAMADVSELVLIHHDPAHSDDFIDDWVDELADAAPTGLRVRAAKEGETFDVG